MSIAGPKSSLPYAVPRLEPGDHLTRIEFERRYDATPGLKHAELIEGVVHMAPPVWYADHGQPHADLMTLLGLYRAETPGVLSADNCSVKLDLDNMPQPDGCLFISPELGGQARIDDERYILGAPELIAEIASSSVSLDLHEKLTIYRRNGVKEYVVWRTTEKAVDYFVLRNSRFEPLRADADGAYKSEVFPGFSLAAKHLLKADLAGAVRLLTSALKSPEHAAFVRKLAGAGRP